MASPSKWGSVLRLDGDVGDTYRSEIAALADGRFIATWMVQTASGQQQVHGQLLNADGSPKGAEFTLPVLLPGEMSVTGLTDGGFAIAWQVHATAFPPLQAQAFDVHGSPTSAPFFVSGTTADLEYTPHHETGWREGRDPSADFDTTLYLIHNPDVAAAGVDPLTHFNTFGWQEGRQPNGWFDPSGYLAHYADVAASGVNPLEHFEQFGWREGRDPSAGFDTLGYLTANPGVAAAGVNPLDHYLMFGIYEGRQAVNDGLWH